MYEITAALKIYYGIILHPRLGFTRISAALF